MSIFPFVVVSIFLGSSLYHQYNQHKYIQPYILILSLEEPDIVLMHLQMNSLSLHFQKQNERNQLLGANRK